ncbi:hypothetical protein Q5752_000998 [Cryptotrichosporon argae]
MWAYPYSPYAAHAYVAGWYRGLNRTGRWGVGPNYGTGWGAGYAGSLTLGMWGSMGVGVW